jgi:hypothetical protein
MDLFFWIVIAGIAIGAVLLIRRFQDSASPGPQYLSPSQTHRVSSVPTYQPSDDLEDVEIDLEEWDSFAQDGQELYVYASDYLDRIPAVVHTPDTPIRGTGMRHKESNWVGMYKKMHLRRGQEVETWAVLVPQHGNPYDSNAVAICVQGRHVGFIPATDSSQIKRFVAQNGGLVKVRVTLWFDPGITKNAIGIHISMPPKMADDFETDLKAVFWTGSRWRTDLIGFLEG